MLIIQPKLRYRPNAMAKGPECLVRWIMGYTQAVLVLRGVIAALMWAKRLVRQ